MKKVNLTSPSYSAGSWILISDLDSLIKYMEYTSGKVVSLVSGLIKDEVPTERWDHCIRPNHEGSILAATMVRCQIQGKNPILEMDNTVMKKFNNMMNDISKGRQILVNSNGGYHFVTEEHVWTEEEEMDVSFKPTYVVNENTKYINLENDPKLEEHSKKYLNDKDDNYSYILNLGEHSKEQLTAIFKEFVSKGGEVVYVYTTGMKTTQMYEYFDTAFDCGIKKFEFEFNSGLSNGINEFLKYATKIAEVEYKEL